MMLPRVTPIPNNTMPRKYPLQRDLSSLLGLSTALTWGSSFACCLRRPVLDRACLTVPNKIMTCLWLHLLSRFMSHVTNHFILFFLDLRRQPTPSAAQGSSSGTSSSAPVPMDPGHLQRHGYATAMAPQHHASVPTPYHHLHQQGPPPSQPGYQYLQNVDPAAAGQSFSHPMTPQSSSPPSSDRRK